MKNFCILAVLFLSCCFSAYGGGNPFPIVEEQNFLPTSISPLDRLTGAQSIKDRKTVFNAMSLNDRVAAWKDHLTQVLAREDLNLVQREAIRKLIPMLRDLQGRVIDSKPVEAELLAAFPNRDARLDIFTVANIGGVPANLLENCNCNTGSWFSCSSCLDADTGDGCWLCQPQPTGCGFLGQYGCDGFCTTPGHKCH